MHHRILTATVLFTITTTFAEASSFTLLGDLPGGATFSRALGISADGAVVVGDSAVANSNRHAFQWTAGGGMLDLGTLPSPFPFGGSSYAYGVSGNGSVIVGSSDGFPVGGGYRWTASTGMVPLVANQSSGGASAVSRDGSVIVGSNITTGAAFRWTSSGGLIGLGDLPGGRDRSQALGVSGDGSVAVGWSEVPDDIHEAFRWTIAGGMVSLGDLPGEGSASSANAASVDGSVIVGVGNEDFRPEAFRWTAADGMVGLGDLPGGNDDSAALAVSADGSVIVGRGDSRNGPGGNETDEAFIWTAAGGMQRLMDVLVSQGATGLDDWLLLDATGISADGTAIVGMAEDVNGTRFAYLARVAIVPLPAPAWMFGGALGLLGIARRRLAT